MPVQRAPDHGLAGLSATLHLLAKTQNEAALGVLIPALDSPHREIQEGALRALLDRRSVLGQREVLKRLHTRADHWRPIIKERTGRLLHALRDGVLGADRQLCANACQAILWFNEYDLTPSLLAAAEDETHFQRQQAAETLLALAQLLYDELCAPRDYSNRRDPQLVRNHVISSLEPAVQRYSKHHRVEVIQAFLILANRDNVTLKQILQDPHHPSYLPLVDSLLHSERGGIVRLLLNMIDDPHAPSAALTVLARRSDPKFIRHLLRKIGSTPSAIAAQNLKRIEAIAWLRGDLARLRELDDAAQHSAVQLVMATGMNRLEAFKVIELLLRHGKTKGRRAAATVLAQFSGADANALALDALGDGDPEVQAALLVQLRARGIPGALTRLIEMVDSPHEAVSQAARTSLAEFNFERFLAAFDMLDEDVRHSTGVLVRKINPDCLEALGAEITARSRTRRLRGLTMAAAMRVVTELESTIVELLADDDHLVRGEAARALAFSDTPSSRAALDAALNDRSVSVQDQARDSLDRLNKSTAAKRQNRDVAGNQEPAA